MAFVSIDKMKKFTRDGGGNSGPAITITSRGIGYVTQAVYGSKKPSTIEIEIDVDEKIIRLKTGDDFNTKLTGRVRHTFNIPVAVRREIVPDNEARIKIQLEKSDDGWWYGRYSEAEQ
jgi:hypothetical protein